MNATAAHMFAGHGELTPAPDQLPAGQAFRSLHPERGGNVLARRLASPVPRIVAAPAVTATGRRVGLERSMSILTFLNSQWSPAGGYRLAVPRRLRPPSWVSPPGPGCLTGMSRHAQLQVSPGGCAATRRDYQRWKHWCSSAG